MDDYKRQMIAQWIYEVSAEIQNPYACIRSPLTAPDKLLNMTDTSPPELPEATPEEPHSMRTSTSEEVSGVAGHIMHEEGTQASLYIAQFNRRAFV